MAALHENATRLEHSDGCLPGILLGIHISIVYDLDFTLPTLDDLHNSSSSNSCSFGNV